MFEPGSPILVRLLAVFGLPFVGYLIGATIGAATCDPDNFFGCSPSEVAGGLVGAVVGLVVGIVVAFLLRPGKG